MSAICGIAGPAGLPGAADLLGRMMQVLTPHGPDGGTVWHDDSACLGHQMMHTTPESLTEILPVFHRQRQVALTVDGRLDNRSELLRELGLSRRQAELSDSQLLIAAYLEWGTACAERLAGEFAFAVWDRPARTLHCFTDPMGIRPLFQVQLRSGHFAFATEIAALLTLGDEATALDERRLAMLGVSALTIYLEPERTCFRAISRIPPATVLSSRDGRIGSRCYWRPDPKRRRHFRSDRECGEAFREVFSAAVAVRLRSAFPTAALLSGGLDSSSIVAAASQQLAAENRTLLTLSSVPMHSAEGRVTDERAFIDLFRNTPRLDMQFVAAENSGPFDRLQELVASGSLPSYSYQHFLYTALVRAARAKGARVILDGHGGELSASCVPRGYLAELLLAGRWRTLVHELQCLDPQRRVRWPAIRSQVLRPLLPYAMLKRIGRQRKLTHVPAYPLRREFVHDVLAQETAAILDEVDQLAWDGPDHRRNMVHSLDLQQHDARQRSQAGFVGHAEAGFTYPYLDRRVIEFALAADGRFKQHGGETRRLLRLGMRDWLPALIAGRTSKAAFSPDYHLRYARNRERVRLLLRGFADSAPLASIVDFDRVLSALEEPVPYDPGQPMRADPVSQFLIPWTVFLCYFLSRFGSPSSSRRENP